MTSTQRKWVVAAGICVVAALAIAWAVGRLQGAAETREVRGQLDAVQPELAKLEHLEARRHLHLAMESLDQRNFGTAQKHLVAAARRLKRSEPEPDGELGALAEEVANTSLVATDDFAEQRGLIQGFIARLDAAVPPAQAGQRKGGDEAPRKKGAR